MYLSKVRLVMTVSFSADWVRLYFFLWTRKGLTSYRLFEFYCLASTILVVAQKLYYNNASKLKLVEYVMLRTKNALDVPSSQLCSLTKIHIIYMTHGVEG